MYALWKYVLYIFLQIYESGNEFDLFLFTALRKSIRMEGKWGRQELEMGVVVNAFNFSSLILGRGRWLSMNLRSAWSRKGVQDQSRLCRETLSQKKGGMQMSNVHLVLILRKCSSLKNYLES